VKNHTVPVRERRRIRVNSAVSILPCAMLQHHYNFSKVDKRQGLSHENSLFQSSQPRFPLKNYPVSLSENRSISVTGSCFEMFRPYKRKWNVETFCKCWPLKFAFSRKNER